ncbi:MAG: M48 family peptidase [Burkholderiaceae bacterium]|nr:MAG: M48 family peptidase [Burkholderiaceae bacterium]
MSSDATEPELSYLRAYPLALQLQIRKLISEQRLADYLLSKYPDCHEIRTDKALYQYVQELKSEHMRNGEQLSKVVFDNKLHVIRNALGTHSYVSRVQGSKLKTKNEIRIASLFKLSPDAFLKMIVVHELAHLKQKEHDKAFYQLCTHLEPQYHQYELDCRIYLSYLDLYKEPLWSAKTQTEN